MRVVVRGWNRDCGEKEIMNTDQLTAMPVAPENIGAGARGDLFASSEDKVLGESPCVGGCTTKF